ncbi:hypothetical protein BUE80_DR010173 [Diplocarpon rosae]|nr:hypothetical protein BUE80_DR010173 [Diplocarpon rosae]
MEISRSQTPVCPMGRSQATAIESVPETPGFRGRVVQRPPLVIKRKIEVQKDPAPKLKRSGITLKRFFSISQGGKREKAEAIPVYKDPTESPRETAAQAQARVLWEEQAKRYTDFASLLGAQTFPGNQAPAPTPGLVPQHAYRPARRSDMAPPRSRTFPQHNNRNQTQTQSGSRSPVQVYTHQHFPIPEAEAVTVNEARALARLRWEAHEKPFADMAARPHYLSQGMMTPSRGQSLPQDHHVPESAYTDIGIEESPELPVQGRESERRETGEAQFLWRRSEDLAEEYRFLIQQWLHPWEDDGTWI